MKSFFTRLVLLVICAAITGTGAIASEIEWSVNGVAICTATGKQEPRHIISDGRGGAFIGWMDERSGYDYPELFVQKVDSSGTVQWTSNGVAVKIGGAFLVDWQNLRLAADGEGGLIAVWEMDDVYAQRIDADGNAVWGSGVVIESEWFTEMFFFPRIVSDWNGGAIIIFYDLGLFAQRIDADGATVWQYNKYIGPVLSLPDQYDMIADGEGGAFITYQNLYGDIKAYALNHDGGSSWLAGGRIVCDVDSSKSMPQIVSDGAGGCIVTWYDKRNHSSPTYNAEIYAQRYNAAGERQWTINGIQATPTLFLKNSEFHDEYTVMTDDSCGAVIAVPDSGKVLAQRIRCDGTQAWGTDGVVVCDVHSDQPHPQVAPDGAGGAVVAWRDDRSSPPKIYAQRLDRSGNACWTANGVAICSQNSTQTLPVMADGGIVAWTDLRNPSADIYAQRLSHPSLQYVPSCSLWAEYDRDICGTVTADADTFMCGCPGGDWDRFIVCINLDDNDMVRNVAAGELTLWDYSADSLYVFWLDPVHADSAATDDNDYQTSLSDTCVSVNTPCGSVSCDYCTTDSVLVRFREYVLGYADDIVVKSPDYNGDGKVYLSDLGYFGQSYNKAKGDEGYNDYFDFNGDDKVNLSDWAFMGEHYNHSLPLSAAAPMYLAGAGRSSARARIATLMHGDRLLATVYFEADVSLSSLAIGFDGAVDGYRFADWLPHPSFATTTAVAQVRNHGRDMIFMSAFALDRVSNGEIELGTMEFVTDVDIDPDEFVCAILFGEALGADGSIVQVDVRTDGGEETPALRNHLGANYPNPFNPTTRIDFTIERDAHVTLSVYNVKGALVRTLVDGFRPAAHYSVTWDGINDRGGRVSSGVYFYRIKTAFFEQSSKMILLR